MDCGHLPQISAINSIHSSSQRYGACNPPISEAQATARKHGEREYEELIVMDEDTTEPIIGHVFELFTEATPLPLLRADIESQVRAVAWGACRSSIAHGEEIIKRKSKE